MSRITASGAVGFLRLNSVHLESIFKDLDGLNLASFYHLLPYFSHWAALAFRYSKGMV